MSNQSTVDHIARAEDLAFMAAHGETFDGAARRLGLTRQGLDRWASVHGQRHLLHALARNGRAA